MKYILEKYEWLFYILYKNFKKVYSERADPAMYAFGVLNFPIFILIGILIMNLFPHVERIYVMLFGGLLFVLAMNTLFSDARIAEIEKRYEKEKGSKE